MIKRETDREAYEKRAQDVRDRIAAGEKIDDILAARQAEVSMALLRKALEEG